MSEAAEAYRIAEARIAEAKATGAKALNLSTFEFEHEGTTFPGDKRLRALASIPPELADLTALTRLSLSRTQAADLAPLAGLTALTWLFLSGPDDDPLRLVAPGAPWEREDRGLRRLFLHERALGDAALAGLVADARKPRADNAPAVLARLREIRDARTPPAPPAPRPDDWRFEAGPDGRLRLADAPLDGGDADQAEMQADLRRRAEALAASLSGSNEFAGLAEDARRYAALLARPAAEIGAKAVWALSCIFRAALAADEAAEAEGRMSDMLPPLARAALTGAVTIGGAWLLDHPGVAAEEAKARAWRAAPGEDREAEAALPLLELLAEDAAAVEPATAETVGALARFGLGGPIGRKAVLDAARGAGVRLLRTAWRAVKWVGGGLILIDGLTGGAKVALDFIAAHAPTLRAWLAVSAPEALRFFDALVALLKSAIF